MSAEMTQNRLSMWGEIVLRPYLAEVARRHGIVETVALPNMRDLPPVRLEAMFVQPALANRHVSASEPVENWPEGMPLVKVLLRERRLVVLGDPGAGKTTLGNWLAWRLAAGLNAPLPDELSDCLPIPCVLRELPANLFRGSVSICDLAVAVAGRLLGTPIAVELQQAFASLINAGQFVLILDGVDEVSIEHRQRISKWIRDVGAKGFVMATGRVVGYDDMPVDCTQSFVGIHHSPLRDRKKILSRGLSKHLLLELGEGAVQVSWATRAYLMPFDRVRVQSFVEHWYLQREVSESESRPKSKDLLAAIEGSQQLEELSRTPNLLSLMAIVHRERGVLPDGKALLYKEISNAYINTIDDHRKLNFDGLLVGTSLETKEGWLAYVAYRMQLERNFEEENSGILSSEQSVLQWLCEAMESSGEKNPTESAEQFLKWVARRSGLLLPRGEGIYSFVHLSFQEYFCARYLAMRIVTPSFVLQRYEATSIVITHMKMRELALRSNWVEVFVNLFELISSERDPEWAVSLLDTLFDTENSKEQLLGFGPELAIKLLVDSHIKLPITRRNALINRCVAGAAFDAEYVNHIGDYDEPVLVGLGKLGRAAVITDNAELASRIGLPLLVRQESGKYILPKELLVLFLIEVNFNDLTDLCGAPDLAVLSIHRTQLHTLEGVVHFKRLNWLFAYQNPNFSTIESLDACTELRSLDISHSNISNLEPIGQLQMLETLNIFNTKVHDLSVLSNCNNLTAIYATSTEVREINCPPLVNRLRILTLDHCPIENLRPIEGARNLAVLSLAHTKIADLAPLAQLGKLKELNIAGTKVEDLSPILHLKALAILYLDDREVWDISILRNMKGLTISGHG